MPSNEHQDYEDYAGRIRSAGIMKPANKPPASNAEICPLLTSNNTNGIRSLGQHRPRTLEQQRGTGGDSHHKPFGGR